MKRLILVTMMFSMLSIAGCGSELVYVEQSPPSISTHKQAQDLVNYYVTGSIDFYAPDNDVDTVEIIVVNSRGNEVDHTLTSLGSFAGRSSGTISFTIDYYNYGPDYYSYTVSLTDKAGWMSNPVYGSFRVI